MSTILQFKLSDKKCDKIICCQSSLHSACLELSYISSTSERVDTRCKAKMSLVFISPTENEQYIEIIRSCSFLSALNSFKLNNNRLGKKSFQQMTVFQ